jgi:hypothetical protein
MANDTEFIGYVLYLPDRNELAGTLVYRDDINEAKKDLEDLVLNGGLHVEIVELRW